MFDKFPENRYTALEEVQELLRFRRFDLLSFLETLAKADDAFLRYNFGNLSVTFTVSNGLIGFVKSSDENEAAYEEDPGKTVISICLEIEKGDIETSATYDFTIDEVKGICKAKQLKVESFGGSQLG
jgi:hypothetical protein